MHGRRREQRGGGGNTVHVGACGVGVRAREERGTLNDEAFPWQRCQTELKSPVDGAAGSAVTGCLCISVMLAVDAIRF